MNEIKASVNTNVDDIALKADLNGNSLETFEVANGTLSTHAVNKSQLDAVVSDLQGALIPQGNWNASTNSPDISSATTTGYYWIVNVAGATDIGGITDWEVNDWVVKTETGWAKIDNSEKVTSVAGKVGAVTLQVSDLTDSSNVALKDQDNNFSVGQTINGDLSLNSSAVERFSIKRNLTKVSYDLSTSNFHLDFNSIGSGQRNIRFYNGVSTPTLRYEIDANGNHDFKSGTATFGGNVDATGQTVTANTLVLLNSDNSINSGSNSSLLRFSGGSTSSNGAGLLLGGSTNVGIPNQGLLRVGASNIMLWNSLGINVTGTATADNFVGDGSGLTNVNAETLNQVSAINLAYGDSYISNFRDKMLDLGDTYFPNSTAYSIALDKQLGLRPSIHIAPASVNTSILRNISNDRTPDLDFTRNSTATYIDEDGVMQTAPINVPRIDFSDGGTGALLVEPQSTNLVVQSEDNLVALNSGVITNNAGTSPSGSGNAQEVTFGATVNDGAQILTSTISVLGNTQYTISFYVKNVSGSGAFNLRIDTNTTAILVNQEFTASADWVRYTHTFTTDLSATSITAGTRLRSVLNGNTIQFWGFQIEQLSYPTSYIPTSGTTVTRVAETLSKTGLSNYINSSEGVLYAEMSTFSFDATDRFFSISDGTLNNRIVIYYNKGANNLLTTQVIVGGVAQSIISDSSFTLEQNNKLALKFSENDFALWVNGVEVGTDISGNTFSANTLNKLSFDRGTSVENFYGKVKDLRVYNQVLTDTKLQQLTTL